MVVVRRPPVPPRIRRPRVDRDPGRPMLRAPRFHGNARYGPCGAGGDHLAAVRPEEPESARAVRLDAKAVVVNVRVVPAAERAQILERGRSAAGPGHDVVPVHPAIRTAREATAAVPQP